VTSLPVNAGFLVTLSMHWGRELRSSGMRLPALRIDDAVDIPDEEGQRNPVRWDAVDIYRITDDGRISEQWAFEDLAAILRQVGAIALPWAG
jgi:hypothetical protein